MNVGVFTTIKIKNGMPLFWDQHQERLVTQAEKLNLGRMNISFSKIQNYLQKNALADCALKITITKKNKSVKIFLEHRQLPQTFSIYKLVSIKDTRNYRKIYKTTDRTVNKNAKKIAVEQKANDALFTVDKNLIESTQ